MPMFPFTASELTALRKRATALWVDEIAPQQRAMHAALQEPQRTASPLTVRRDGGLFFERAAEDPVIATIRVARAQAFRRGVQKQSSLIQRTLKAAIVREQDRVVGSERIATFRILGYPDLRIEMLALRDRSGMRNIWVFRGETLLLSLYEEPQCLWEGVLMSLIGLITAGHVGETNA